MNVDEKVAIVTGSSSGIGQAIALKYAEYGMKVVCADIDDHQGNALIEDITSAGGNAVYYHVDVSDSNMVRNLIAFTHETYGRLDGIVNCAGIGQGGFRLHDYQEMDYDKVISINQTGVFYMMKHGITAMLDKKIEAGFIINIASVAGMVSQSGQSLYSASKHAIIGMSKSAAIEYAPYGLTINTICPGYIHTPIFGNLPDQALAYFHNQCPSGKMGAPEDCANLALFLASDMARYISGAVIPVDGALSAGAKNIIHQ